MTLFDPLHKVTLVWVRIARKDALKLPVAANKDGTWPALADSTPQPLKAGPGAATGKVMARARAADKGPVEFLVQPVLGTADGKTLPRPAVGYRFDFARGTLEPTDRPPAGAVAGGPDAKGPAAGRKAPPLTGIRTPARPARWPTLTPTRKRSAGPATPRPACSGPTRRRPRSTSWTGPGRCTG